MNAALELQKAVFAALSGDAALVTRLGGARIHDRTPARAEFPYVTLGRMSATDHSTASERADEALMTLNVWSQAKGKREVLEIAELVRAALDDAPLALAAGRLTLIRFEALDVRYDAAADAQQGAMRFRAIIEQQA